MNYTWTSKAGKENSVKSYASTVLGWHWGWKADKAATELPVRVGDRKPVKTSWEFSVSSGSEVFRGSGQLDTKAYSVDIG